MNFSFIPKSLQYETQYVFKLKKGVQTVYRGLLESDVEGRFTTIGSVKVISMYPSNGANSVDENTKINFYFAVGIRINKKPRPDRDIYSIVEKWLKEND